MGVLTVGFARHPTTSFIECLAAYGERRGPYFLDSGATFDVLNSRVHPFELGEELEATYVEMEGESHPVHTYESAGFRIGRYHHQPGHVVALDLPYDASDGQPVHGLLGLPLFRETPIGIDWDRQVLSLGDPPARPALAQLPIRLHDTYAAVEIQVGSRHLAMRLETAATFGILIETAAFPLTDYLHDEEVPLPGPDGSLPSVRITLPRVQVGELHLSDLAATVAIDASAKADGRLGLKFLTKYTCWIDLPRGQLTLFARSGS